MADFAMQELGAMTVAVLTEAGDTYSEGLSTVFIDDSDCHRSHERKVSISSNLRVGW